MSVTSTNKKLPLWSRDYDFTSCTPLDLSKFTRSDLKRYFVNTYSIDEGIFSALKDPKYLYTCPDRLRLPLVFYVAHPSSVYVNKLLLGGVIDKRVNLDYEIMFETGVDEMSWDDTENYRMGGAYQWPKVEDVLDYRKQVYDTIMDVIDQQPLKFPVTQDSPWWSLFLGLEHERIHLETSSVLIRQLPIEVVQTPPGWKYAPLQLEKPAGENTLIRVPSGKAFLGKPDDFPSYGWDNEYGRCEMNVPEFEANKYPVTNREFLEFVKDGGYQKKELWNEEGWQWMAFREVKHPIFWVCRNKCKSNCGASLSTYSHCDPKHFDNDAENGTANGHNGVSNGHSQGEEYLYRAMYDLFPLPLDWPVEVNYHEAKAFCKWKGPEYRLPTEAEYHIMRCDPPLSNKVDCDPVYNPDYPANINLKFGSSSPVHMFPANELGFHDIYGNVWEWTEDQFNGLPNFRTSYLYDDFSSPCFDGRHTMILGGSWISTGDEASRFARFSFRRHFYQHAGFRMVCSKETTPTPVRLCKAEVFILGAGVQNNPLTVHGVSERNMVVTTNRQFDYETVEALDKDLSSRYLSGKAELVSEYCEALVLKLGISREKAVEFGCGSGLSSFLLTKTFKEVLGVDYSGILVDAAMKIQEGNTVTTSDGKEISLNGCLGVNPSRAVFKQLTWTPNEVSGFDFYLLSFLDRVANPDGWLRKAWEVLSSDGVMVIASEKWNGELLLPYLDKWFNLKSEDSVAGSAVTAWSLK
jgi:5-histidylcysteine sulfoxide synthase